MESEEKVDRARCLKYPNVYHTVVRISEQYAPRTGRAHCRNLWIVGPTKHYHHRLRCAFLIFAFCARCIAGVGFAASGTFLRGCALNTSPFTCTMWPRMLLRTVRAFLSVIIRCPLFTCASFLLTSHDTVSQLPLRRLPARRSKPPFLPTS